MPNSVLTDLKSGLKTRLTPDKTSPEYIRAETIKRARTDFHAFCMAINPDFYRPDRTYQKILCDTLQSFWCDKGTVLLSHLGVTKEPSPCHTREPSPYHTDTHPDILIISIPPGFGKSYTASLFTAWLYGQNLKNQIIEISYNQILSVQFSKTVRELILDEPYGNEITVREIFPNVRIKQGDSAMERWSLEGWHNSYIATSFDGSLTGMRGTVGIIDDPIKNAYEALNDNVKDKHYDFYKNTFSSRILDGGKQIIIQTRWATDDLAGRIIKNFPARVRVLEMQALDKNGSSLCESLYGAVDLIKKRETLDKHIWSANYQQIPIDIKGALYQGFKTYLAIDEDAFERRVAYIDTADEGADFLCCIAAGIKDGYAYITDVYYTKDPMEITERETARRLTAAGVRECIIESNNGGRGFARSVETALKQAGNRRCQITWFSQNKNKRTRILVNSATVQDRIIFPQNYEKIFPDFTQALFAYQREGRNKHDDAPDALTGIAEILTGDVKGRKKARVYDIRKLGL